MDTKQVPVSALSKVEILGTIIAAANAYSKANSLSFASNQYIGYTNQALLGIFKNFFNEVTENLTPQESQTRGLEEETTEGSPDPSLDKQPNETISEWQKRMMQSGGTTPTKKKDVAPNSEPQEGVITDFIDEDLADTLTEGAGQDGEEEEPNIEPQEGAIFAELRQKSLSELKRTSKKKLSQACLELGVEFDADDQEAMAVILYTKFNPIGA